MQKEVFTEFVPRQSLPPHVQKKFPKDKFLRVHYEPDHEVEFDDDGKPMPPESAISDELIKSVQASEKDLKEGRYTVVKNEDVSEYLNNLWKNK